METDEAPPPAVLKLILVGDSGVGKTSLLQRLASGTFSENHVTTVGIDFQLDQVKIGGRSVGLQLWDTSGEARFRGIISAYYRGAHAIGLVFDLADRKTFLSLPGWLTDVRSVNGDAQVLLIGNKSDLTGERSVSRKEAEAFAEEAHMEYAEVSARCREGARSLFHRWVAQLLDRLPRAAPEKKRRFRPKPGSFLAKACGFLCFSS